MTIRERALLPARRRSSRRRDERDELAAQLHDFEDERDELAALFHELFAAIDHEIGRPWHLPPRVRFQIEEIERRLVPSGTVRRHERRDP
jgi:hypothetical protein